MKIGFVCPTFGLFGGIKRAFNISKILKDKGHKTIIYSPDLNKPSWLDYNITIRPYESIFNDQLDFLFFLNPTCTDKKWIKLSRSRYKIIYILNNGGKYKKPYQYWIDRFKHDDSVLIAGNNGLWKKNYETYDKKSFDLIGGIDLDQYCPVRINKNKDYINILIQGRVSREWKGTKEIIKAIERIITNKRIRLLAFNTESLNLKTNLIVKEFINIPQEKMKEVYSQADLFVHFEDNTSGWSNTCAEAMACNVPIICTKYGTSDFAIHNKTAYVINRNQKDLIKAIETMINNKDLRDKLAVAGNKKIKEFTWNNLVDKIEKYFYKMI